MIKIDIPMYIKRCKLGEKNNLSFIESVKDMAICKNISQDFNVWKSDIPWFTGYFTSGSWSAIIFLLWYCANKKIL